MTDELIEQIRQTYLKPEQDVIPVTQEAAGAVLSPVDPVIVRRAWVRGFRDMPFSRPLDAAKPGKRGQAPTCRYAALRCAKESIIHNPVSLPSANQDPATNFDSGGL